jgi:hypothetical protein
LLEVAVVLALLGVLAADALAIGVMVVLRNLFRETSDRNVKPTNVNKCQF